MLRPKGKGARNAPFLDPTALTATASEMGKLAIQVGENIDAFFPGAASETQEVRLAFGRTKAKWIKEFYSAS